MTKRREVERSRLRLLAGMAALPFAASCGQNESAQSNASRAAAAAQGQMVLNRGNGAEPKSLDPHHSEGTWEINIIGDLLLGLTTEDVQCNPIPGAATSWETSADGKTWTFHLRDHLWSDGRPVTAGDFVYAWRRIFDPKTAAAYASILYAFKNGEAINAGKMPPESLGAKAIDDKTLELRLEHPVPYLPELLMHQTAYPVPRHVVETLGDAWTKPGNYVGNGAYVLKEWTPNEHITIEKNPRFYDAANVKVERVVYYPTVDSEAALKRFRAGELDTQDPLPANEIDYLRRAMADSVQIKPYFAASYFVCNQTRKPFDDPRVREALNLAVDREAISEKLRRLGEPPAYSIVPPGMANYPDGIAFDFKALAYPDRIKRGQELMREAGYGPDKRLRATLSTTTNPDTKRTAAVVQQMWKQVYVDISLLQNEVQVNYLKLQNGDFDIGSAGWVSDYNDARNFLFLLMTNDGGLNYGRYHNPKFDALMDQSDQEPDAMKRGALMAEAEKLALKDFAWIPVYGLVTMNLVRPYVKGWTPNLHDFHRTRWISIDEQARAATPRE